MSENTASWSFEGEPAPLERVLDLGISRVKLTSPVQIDRKSIDDATRNKIGKQFASPKLGILGGLTAPSGRDVDVQKVEEKFVPYWVLAGTYACRYLRKASYSVSIKSDVEEVRIHGQEQMVSTTRKKLSDVIAAVASSASVGVGPASISAAPAQDIIAGALGKALGGRDKELSKESSLTIPEAMEHAVAANSATVCFDANHIAEDKSVPKLLASGGSLTEVSKAVESKSLDVRMDRDAAVEAFVKEVVRPPDIRPQKITEQVVRLTKLELLFVPSYEILAEAKGQSRKLRLDPFTGDVGPA